MATVAQATQADSGWLCFRIISRRAVNTGAQLRSTFPVKSEDAYPRSQHAYSCREQAT